MAIERPSRPTPGAIALVGSGEYLDVMNTTDTYLLNTIGGASNARVVLLPTASGLEANGPVYWNELGLRHFQQLGVKDIRATQIIDRESAANPEQLTLLKDADFYYFSGGNPQHCIETFRGSPAWDIIMQAHAEGAILAGCSAGAMTFSAFTISIRQVRTGEKPGWSEALGLVPHVIVFPHFDRMAGFIGQAVFQELLAALPAGYTTLGIDENTALVRTGQVDKHDPMGGVTWQVMGQQTVNVFQRDKAPRILRAGEEIML